MSRRKLWAGVCLFVMVQLFLILLFYNYFKPKAEPAPPVYVAVTQVWYGEIHGVGLITDPEKTAMALDCVDNLEYYNDDDSNIPSGGGLEITVFQGETIRRYSFVGGTLVKNFEDPNVKSWYNSQTDIFQLLQDSIQKSYLYDESFGAELKEEYRYLG